MAVRVIGTPLEQQSWDNVLRMESMTRDIYQDFEGTFAEDIKTILPNGIIGNVNLTGAATKQTIGLLKNLSGAGITGRGVQLNNEIDQELKELDVFSNDTSQAVNTERYGIDAHSKEGIKILEKVQPQLSRWRKELDGKYIRESFLERYSSNLLTAPVSLTQRWNENVLIKNLALTAQPVYDSTNATYESNISAAGVTAGAGTAWDVAFLNAMIFWITSEKKIEPMDNGRYIVSVPARQAIGLLDPSGTNSISGIFKDSHLVEASTNAYKQYLGSYGILDLFNDPRAPVIDDNAADLTALYKGAGDDDDRDSGTGIVYDVGIVHGKSGVIKAVHEQQHFEEEVQNYSKVVGVGSFSGHGYNRTVYDDIGAESDTSEINQNSAILLTRRNTITT